MAVQINSASLGQMTDIVNRSFTRALEDYPQVMRRSGLVVDEPMSQGTGDSRRFAERIHRSKYATTRDEGDNSPQALVQYGYEKDLQVTTETLEVSITKRMRVAGKRQDIIDSITNISEVCPAAIELDLTHRLTFATATSYRNRSGVLISIDVGDDLALISSVHTLTGSSTTYSNVITGNPQFSKGALETGERLVVEETYDNLGQRRAMKFDKIVTGLDPNTVNQVRELLNATADIDTSNSGTFNVYGVGKYQHEILPELATDADGATDTTKRKRWAIASSSNSSLYLSVLEEPYLKTPTDGNNGENFSSENWSYLAGTTYGITTVDGRWIKLSTGLGS